MFVYLFNWLFCAKVYFLLLVEIMIKFYPAKSLKELFSLSVNFPWPYIFDIWEKKYFTSREKEKIFNFIKDKTSHWRLSFYIKTFTNKFPETIQQFTKPKHGNFPLSLQFIFHPVLFCGRTNFSAQHLKCDFVHFNLNKKIINKEIRYFRSFSGNDFIKFHFVEYFFVSIKFEIINILIIYLIEKFTLNHYTHETELNSTFIINFQKHSQISLAYIKQFLLSFTIVYNNSRNFNF